MKTPQPHAQPVAAPADRPARQHCLDDQNLKTLFGAGDRVMHGRRFTEDATEIIRDAREHRDAG